MEYAYSILMGIFSAAILLYAGLMALTKNYNILPVRARQSVKPKHPKEYMLQLSKIVALAALAVALGAAVALWRPAVGAIVLIAGVVAALWAGTKIIQKAL